MIAMKRKNGTDILKENNNMTQEQLIDYREKNRQFVEKVEKRKIKNIISRIIWITIWKSIFCNSCLMKDKIMKRTVKRENINALSYKWVLKSNDELLFA